MKTRTHTLTFALLATLGLGGNALAQDQSAYPAQAPMPPMPPTGEMPPPPPVPNAPMPPAAPMPPDAAMPPDVPMPPPPPGNPMPPMGAAANAQVNVTSHPGNPAPRGPFDFDALDGNHNGSISRAEAKGNAALAYEFHLLDRNHDGRLTKQEMTGWHE